ncbi:hypothetical protein FEE95_16505 [Maribacter algarum]|uniref:Uncharacterized protein n=1 Tax=Maribacter algarum (ex Zhang et al. 2020) TaxID=2578118 RepID=A0A5S3PPC0_9FLAO|nr:hypothetical protein [Maribacter algarum]TMM56221.1 hypothetical protein FEE95_16505 [Maribacter algarum]
MAPNKFEKHMKKQLQEREIKPSANAWETLSERLDAVTPQSKRRNYFWYGIAASFIGFLIISIVYFNSNNALNGPDVKVADTDEETIEAKTNSDSIDDRKTEEVIVENEKSELVPSQEVEAVIRNENSELSNQITSVAKVDKVVGSLSEKAIKTNDFKEEIINDKILEIVATVDSLEQNNAALTDAEVNHLLRNAQEEILRDKLFNQNGSVDAMALLTEVEDELDRSFRDQIFESLRTGFLKVRTAVADRNK